MSKYADPKGLEKLVRYNLWHTSFDEKKGLLYLERGRPHIGKLEDDLPSTLVGGLPRRGKTMCACMWACTIALAGGQLCIIDPHTHAPRDTMSKTLDPLREWFTCPPIDFSDTNCIVQQFQALYAEFEDRARGNTAGKKLLYVIVDEWSGLIDRFDPESEEDKIGLETVLRTVRTLAKEGRKFGCYVTLIAHQWQLADTGGSAIRKSVTGRVAFDAELTDIKLILGTRDLKKIEQLTTPSLRKGEAIMKTDEGLRRVSFLKTTREDVELVARVIRRVHSAHSDGYSSRVVYLARAEGEQGEIAHVGRDHAENVFRNGGPSNLKVNLNEAERALNALSGGLNVRISEAERRAIIEQGNKQMRETGRVVRTKIRDDLGMNNYQYKHLIKPLCDALGWTNVRDRGMTDEQWEGLKRLYNYTCLSCGRREPVIKLEPDHIVPRSRGGSDDVSNRQPLCRDCNNRKLTKKTDYRAGGSRQ